MGDPDKVTRANERALLEWAKERARAVDELRDELEFRKNGKRVFPNPLGVKREKTP